MFDGAQTELPSKEQFYAPRPKVAVDDPTEEAVAVIIKKGGLGVRMWRFPVSHKRSV